MSSNTPRSDAELTAAMEASARAIGLIVPENCRPGIIANMKVLDGHIARVMALPVEAHDEIAPVYLP